MRPASEGSGLQASAAAARPHVTYRGQRGLLGVDHSQVPEASIVQFEIAFEDNTRTIHMGCLRKMATHTDWT
jgi:hypothetical protein